MEFLVSPDSFTDLLFQVHENESNVWKTETPTHWETRDTNMLMDYSVDHWGAFTQSQALCVAAGSSELAEELQVICLIS